MNIKYILESKQGFIRESNQDHADTLATKDGFLAVICDGVGGNNGGETASKLAVNSIIESFKQSSEFEIEDRLTMAITYANRKIKEEALKTPFLKGMATTVVVLFYDGTTATWAYAGDSRLYLYQPGLLTQLTKDHSLLQEMLDRGLITPEETHNFPLKNIITKALGEKDQLEIDVGRLNLEFTDGSKFFLCTDGVSGLLSGDEIEWLLGMEDLSVIDAELTRLVEEKGATDNFTYIIISNK
ncbi:MAG: protein phosphatase 2C domain-containing protein [Ignavibacteriales bacterium]|jgi:Serine/threonine protein phosphatase|nr:MAG: serine/threonine-protein phosphatase [Ignavibacteriaceae bacterium]MBW7872881.1 serine/threonine-protein phosphatase [Ignavibacteria bacterium]MCZ2142490.1 protein phosphatase 2C domain-containing protein [Ignavibacteriales bacterium]OQY76176.1 MAG: hypothetical protein B6D45_04390 [Ignavibacteriales bacterium UTCHB3]MBV6445371.1 Protein phosphatase PrpC [Ignavibacteriaceae bacterium]